MKGKVSVRLKYMGWWIYSFIYSQNIRNVHGGFPTLFSGRNGMVKFVLWFFSQGSGTRAPPLSIGRWPGARGPHAWFSKNCPSTSIGQALSVKGQVVNIVGFVGHSLYRDHPPLPRCRQSRHQKHTHRCARPCSYGSICNSRCWAGFGGWAVVCQPLSLMVGQMILGDVATPCV